MFEWLLDGGVSRRKRARRRKLPGGELTTTLLREELAFRAREADPSVVVIADYRGAGFAVPQLFAFADRLVGVWAYGDDVNAYREIRFKDAHHALDAIAIVTTRSANWQVRTAPFGFPGVHEVEAELEGARLSLAVRVVHGLDALRHGGELYHPMPLVTPPANQVDVAQVLAFLQRAERDAIAPSPADLTEARSAVRVIVRRRPPAKARLTECVIRDVLRPWIAEHHADLPGALIDELTVGSAIADQALASVDGLHLFEIKGESDSLARLPAQAQSYAKVATTATLVVAPRHVSRAFADVPQWWGLVVIEGGAGAPAVRVARKTRLNPDREPRAMLDIMLASELATLAAALGLRQARLLSKWTLLELLAKRIPLKRIAYSVGYAVANRVSRLPRKTAWTALAATWPTDEAQQCVFTDPNLAKKLKKAERHRDLTAMGRFDLIEREFHTRTPAIDDPDVLDLFPGVAGALADSA
jgi:hypothetical protein